MGHQVGRKVPRTIGLTARQDGIIAKESGRLTISEGELIRRIVDWWIEATTPAPKQGDLARKLYNER